MGTIFMEDTTILLSGIFNRITEVLVPYKAVELSSRTIVDQSMLRNGNLSIETQDSNNNTIDSFNVSLSFQNAFFNGTTDLDDMFIFGRNE